MRAKPYRTTRPAHRGAAALEHGCPRVHSEDLQDGQQIEGLTIIDPFRGMGNTT